MTVSFKEYNELDKRRLTNAEKGKVLDVLKDTNPEMYSLLNAHFCWESMWHDRMVQLLFSFKEIVGDHKL